MIDKRAMQSDAPQANSSSRGEIRRDSRAVIAKANAAECGSVTGVQFDAEPGQITTRVRHDAFPTGLVDWRLKCIDKKNVSSVLSQCNGGSQTSGAAAYHQYIGERSHSSDWTLQKASPKAKARLIAAI
jgi:hypothetical protein